jgi:glycerol transport system ATP-binding protein
MCDAWDVRQSRDAESVGARMLKVLGLDLGGATPFEHTFRDGAITVVLGRNNAGKSRLARILSGLETTATGTVWLDERDISALDARRRPAALVFQAFVNYPNLTVAANIASPLVARGVGATERTLRVRDLAERLRIDTLLERYPHELSGGQQQRVAIARALAKDARVLLMDEPLVNLDYKLREELQFELRALLADTGLTVIYTTSDPRDAFALGDEVLLLGDHALLQAGPPLEIYLEPSSLAAADLMSDPGVNAWTDGPVTRAVRPEHLRVGRAGPGDVAFDALLTGVETNGAETYLHCRLFERDWVVRLTGMHAFEPDTSVLLHAAERDLLTFPAAA